MASSSSFFVSKTSDLITNRHVVAGCKKVTAGDKADKQVQAAEIHDGPNA
jgi:S1-C subfamily serine protease